MSARSEFIICLAFKHTRILRRVNNSLSLFGISFSELMVMYHLNNSSGKTMRRINLAESIGLTASGVTRLLNPMQKRGLIQKEVNPRDARESLVKMSKDGERLFKDAMVGFEEISGSVTRKMDKKQMAELSAIMEDLL